MNKEVYKLFTQENGIILSSQTLTYITEHFHTKDSLESLLRSFKTKYGTDAITIEQIKEMTHEKTRDKNVANIKTFKYTRKELNSKFDALKPGDIQITSISMLGNDRTEKTIFGIFFKGKNGRYCIEDDYDVVEIDTSKVQGDVFLFENMFVAAKGIKYGDFKVREFVLPKAKKYAGNCLKDVKMKICVFGCVVNEIDTVKRIIQSECPDQCIISSDQIMDPKIFNCQDTVIFPTKHSTVHLPARNSSGVTNPFLIETATDLIGFIDSNVFEERKKGVFINKNPMESFLRSFASQGTLCPFSGSDLPIQGFPTVYVISQDFHPAVVEVDGIKFMSLPAISEGYYAVIDPGNDIYEIRLISSETNTAC